MISAFIKGLFLALLIAALAWAGVRWFGTLEQAAPVVRLVIGMGASGDDVVNRSGLRLRRSQSADVLLYDASASQLKVDVVPVIEHDGTELVLPRAHTVLFYDRLDRDEGVQEVNIQFVLDMPGVDPGQAPASPAARQRDYALAARETVGRIQQTLREQGWARYIPLSSPRVAGADSYDLPQSWQQGQVQASDPDYLPDAEQWLSLNHTPTWIWYDAGVFFTLSYYRGLSADPQAGLRATVQGERQALLAYVSDTSRHWDAVKAAYAQAIPGLLAQRKAAEASARRQGIKLLEDWVDPAVAGVPVR